MLVLAEAGVRGRPRRPPGHSPPLGRRVAVDCAIPPRTGVAARLVVSVAKCAVSSSSVYLDGAELRDF